MIVHIFVPPPCGLANAKFRLELTRIQTTPSVCIMCTRTQRILSCPPLLEGYSKPLLSLGAQVTSCIESSQSILSKRTLTPARLRLQLGWKWGSFLKRFLIACVLEWFCLCFLMFDSWFCAELEWVWISSKITQMVRARTDRQNVMGFTSW